MTSFFALFSDYARMRRSHYAGETVTVLWCTENSSLELKREHLFYVLLLCDRCWQIACQIYDVLRNGERYTKIGNFCCVIYNGNWTEWSAIWAEIIRVISESNERAAREFDLKS